MSQINPKEALRKGWFIPGDNFDENQQIQQIGIDVTVKPNTSNKLIIKSKSCVNVELNEKVDLPDNVYADMKQRSSFSRMGVFITNGFYDPGFHGVCGLTIYNMGEEDIEIPENSRIAQMVFYEAKAASSYTGEYNSNNSIESRYAKKR